MFRTSEEWIREYQAENALWIHDGNPKRPHALLTSGNHSNGFFNSRLIIPDDALMLQAAADLIEVFIYEGGKTASVNGVIGPQTGATKLAKFLSEQITKFTLDECFSASPAKSGADAPKSMIFSQEELKLLAGQRVLLCEDVLTTGGSVDLTAAAVEQVRGIVLPFVAVLVNRSGLHEVSGKKIVALIDHPMPMWTPAECPLCQEGSEAIPAKGENWARLNAQY